MSRFHQVVVLGMHRSGTSMVAGILHKLGVMLTPSGYSIPSDVSNEAGHFEDYEFTIMNRKILQDAGGNWRNPPPPGAVVSSDTKRWNRAMAALVKRNDEAYECWGWKDPRTVLTIGKWWSLLSDACIIVVARHENAVVASLMARNGMSQSEALGLNETYCKRLVQFGRGIDLERRWAMPYAATLKEPEQTISELADYLGLTVTPEAIAHVRPEMNHWGGENE